MATRQIWDYLVEEDVSREGLAEAGAAGWELVGVAPDQSGSATVFYFKRQAADLRERVTRDHRQRFVAAAEAAQGSED